MEKTVYLSVKVNAETQSEAEDIVAHIAATELQFDKQLKEITVLSQPNPKAGMTFDVYTCEGGHVLIVEHLPKWTDQVMMEVACKFDGKIADYRTSATLDTLKDAIAKFSAEQK